jgi:hypothetical protein
MWSVNRPCGCGNGSPTDEVTADDRTGPSDLRQLTTLTSTDALN